MLGDSARLGEAIVPTNVWFVIVVIELSAVPRLAGGPGSSRNLLQTSFAALYSSNFVFGLWCLRCAISV